jgi:transposase InsO family protein
VGGRRKRTHHRHFAGGLPNVTYGSARAGRCDSSRLLTKHPAVKAWLARNRRITLHFTPTSGSWLNLVEIFFGIITRQAIRRGTFASVCELIEAITRFIDGWNERCEPFAWTKDADTIIAKAHRKSTFRTRH